MAWLCGVFLLFSLHFLSAQELSAGQSCKGEKRDLCAPGLICEGDGYPYFERAFCKVDLNDTCGDARVCRNGLQCDWYSQRRCRIADGADCSQQPDMCAKYRVCDVMNRCAKKAWNECRTAYSRDLNEHQCQAGAECSSYCRCISGVTTMNSQYVCEPNVGIVGGNCSGTNNTCNDPNASCNMTSMLCQCDPEFGVHWEDLSCKVLPGFACSWPDRRCMDQSDCSYPENICKLWEKQSCAGDRSELCRRSAVCVDGVCKGRMGMGSCSLHSDCEPGAVCGDRKCALPLNANCGNYTSDMCKGGYWGSGEHCDPFSEKCKIPPLQSCHKQGTKVCAPGAICKGMFCRCWHTGTSYAPANHPCGLPKGAVGAQCGTTQNPVSGCKDRFAKCKNGTCVCKKGYQTNLNKATCELAGPKCSINMENDLHTFFGVQLPIHLPCSFKLAHYKCGGAEFEVFASRTYSDVINTTYTSDVTVRTTSTKNGVTSTMSYYLSNDLIQEYVSENHTTDARSGSWNRTCVTSNCPSNSKVKDSISSKFGKGVLRRRKMMITYQPFFSQSDYYKKVFLEGERTISLNISGLLIECGHNDFESMENYPDVLCGSTEDTLDTVLNYRTELALEAKQELNDTFGYIIDASFDQQRLMDHAVFRRHKVQHTDARCQETSTILSTCNCAEIHEKMFNCSNFYDEANNRRYHDSNQALCVKQYMDPTQLYHICVHAVCNVTQQLSQDTCQSLQTVADNCDPITSNNLPQPVPAETRPPYLMVGKLREMAGC